MLRWWNDPLEYIDFWDERLSLIVFNFIEYLTSTLCTNLHFGYRTRPTVPSVCISASLLHLDSDYYSVSVLEPPSNDPFRLLPENQP